jgi:two-component system NtrC family sensor kinase
MTRLLARMDFEKQFVLWLATLLVASCFLYVVVDRLHESPLPTLAFVVAVGALAWSIAHHTLLKPIRRLEAMAGAIAKGDFSGISAFPRADAIGPLALAVDTMGNQLQAAHAASDANAALLEQLRHSDRITTLGRLASSVAHELGNPLNVIELRAQLISAGDVPTLEYAQQNARVILEQARRMTRIIDEILMFARMQPAKIARIDLTGVLRTAISLTKHTADKQRVRVLLTAPITKIENDGDADKILQVIVNLVVNGVQAMPDGGTLSLVIADTRRPPIDDPSGEARDYARIDVVDQGTGIDASSVSKVFDPFFSTKHEHGGTGLGLSVAQGIAREHEGWISVESELGKGASFAVFLPKSTAAGAETPVV